MGVYEICKSCYCVFNWHLTASQLFWMTKYHKCVLVIFFFNLCSFVCAFLADILVYINDVCVLGVSHKEVVEMLKSVPVGHSVDIEVRRGYPLLYNPDGRLKQPTSRVQDSEEPILPPTTTQPKSLHQLPRHPAALPQTQHLNFNGVHSDRSYMEPGVTFDANENAPSFTSRPPPPYRRSSVSYAASCSPVRLPRSLRSLARLKSLDPTLASQSDSEVVSAIGSHR